MKKRLAAIFCCLVLCCLLLPVTALAGGPALNYDYQYDDSTRTLRLTGSMAVGKTESGEYPIFEDMSYNNIDPEEIVKIDIGNALTSVDEALLLDSRFKNVHTYCFMGCSTAVVKAGSTPTLSGTTVVHTFNDKNCPSYKWAKGLGSECELEYHSFNDWAYDFDSDTGLPLGVHYHTCSVCGCLEEVPHSNPVWKWSGDCHWKACPVCEAMMGDHSASCTYVQDPRSGKISCSVCGHVVTDPAKLTSFISTSKTVSLMPDMPFTFGAGTYTVSGDPTVYSGNQNFFVKADGQYTFTRR